MAKNASTVFTPTGTIFDFGIIVFTDDNFGISEDAKIGNGDSSEYDEMLFDGDAENDSMFSVCFDKTSFIYSKIIILYIEINILIKKICENFTN